MFTLCLRLLRNFIWSMTSWRRGHTCQQHSTTTQPSRPSKARPVWRPQLFLHTTVLSRRGAVVHTAWFLFLEGFGYLTAGVVATIKTALPFQNYMLPKKKKHQHLFCFYSLCFSCFFFFLSCFEQGLCYVYVSESEACFVAEKEDWPCGTGQWQNKGWRLVFTSVKSRKKKSGKAKWTSSDASERVKEMQCLLLHYI